MTKKKKEEKKKEDRRERILLCCCSWISILSLASKEREFMSSLYLFVCLLNLKFCNAKKEAYLLSKAKNLLLIEFKSQQDDQRNCYV